VLCDLVSRVDAHPVEGKWQARARIWAVYMEVHRE